MGPKTDHDTLAALWGCRQGFLGPGFLNGLVSHTMAGIELFFPGINHTFHLLAILGIVNRVLLQTVHHFVIYQEFIRGICLKQASIG